MWHPFDNMHLAIAVDDALRATPLSPNCRLTYGERTVRWFKDKPKDKPWTPLVDSLPGIVVERKLTGSGTWELKFQQRWRHSLDHTLTGEMTCRDNAWRSPESWHYAQTLKPKRPCPLLPPILESGRWENGTLTRLAEATQNERSAIRVEMLTCIYPLMANFPAKEIDAASAQLQNPAAAFVDGFVFSPSAKLSPGPAGPRQYPLAKGLRNYLLSYQGGLPLEYWVNEHGVVVYVCQGPSVAMVLEKAEVL